MKDAAPVPSSAAEPVKGEPEGAHSRAAEGTRGRGAYGKLAKHGVVWSFFREGVSELIATPTAMIMARLLTPFDFGVAASVGFFLTLATRLTNVGFNQALVRLQTLRPEHCSSVFVVSLLVGAGAYAVLVGAAGLMGAFFRTPEVTEIVPFAALTFLIVPFGTVPAALMTRNMQFRRTAAADWISSFTEAASAIGFAWFGYGYWSIVYGRLFGSLSNAGTKVLLGSWRPSLRFSRVALRELLSFGTGVFAKRLLDYTAQSLDNVVVGRMLGVASLGFYDKAFSTMNKVLVRINTGGPMVSFRIFSLIHEERERFQRAYRKVILAGSLVSYPVLAGLAAAGPDLIIVMYGERWLPAVVPFQILCLAGALRVLNEYAGSAAQAGGRIWDQVRRQVVHTSLIVVCVAAFSGAGLPGAAFGVLVATAAMSVMMNRLLVRTTGIRAASILNAQLPGLLAAVCVAGSILSVRWGLPEVLAGTPSWLLLIAEVAAAGVAYLLFLKFSRFREVRVLLRDLAGDLTPPLGSVARLLT